MSGPRKPVFMGLVWLICTITGHCAESAPATAAPTGARDDKSLLRRIADIAKHVDESRSQNDPESVSQSTSRKESPVDPWDLRNLKSDSRDQIIEVFPRDLRKKEKFLKHLTGPLYFSPKCRKTVYRLYHNTRDCTIPACEFCNHTESHNEFLQKVRAASHAVSGQSPVHGGVADQKKKKG